MTVRGRARLWIAFPMGLVALLCLLALRHSIQGRRPPAAVEDAGRSPVAVAAASHMTEPGGSSTPPGEHTDSPGQALAEPTDVLQRIAEGILSGTGGWRDIAFDKPGELDQLFDDPGFIAFLRRIHDALGPEGPSVLTKAYGLAKSGTYRFLVLSLLSEYDDPRAAEFISDALQSAGSPREVSLAMLCLCRIGTDASFRVAQVYLQTVLDEGRGDLVAHISPAIGRLGARAIQMLLRASESWLASGLSSEQIILGATKGPLSYVRPGNDLAALNRIAREDPRSPIRAMAASAIARGEAASAVPALLELYSSEHDGEVKLWILSSLMDVLGSTPGPAPKRSELSSTIAEILRTTDNPRLFRVAARGAAFLGDSISSDMVKSAFHSDLSARFSRDEAERLRGDLLVDLTWAEESRAEPLVREWFDEQGITPVTLRAASASLQNPSDEEIRRRLHLYLASDQATASGDFHAMRILARYPSGRESTAGVVRQVYWDAATDPMTRLRLIDAARELGSPASGFLREVADREAERLPRFAALEALLQMPESRVQGESQSALLGDARTLILDATSRDPRVDLTYLQAGADGQYERRLGRFAAFVRDVYSLGGTREDTAMLRELPNRLPLAAAPMSDDWKERVRSTVSEACQAAIDTIEFRSLR